jgi:hypothetical protein
VIDLPGEIVLTPPELSLVLALLALGAAGHGLTLLVMGWGKRGNDHQPLAPHAPAPDAAPPADGHRRSLTVALAALSQVMLLVALAGMTLRLLEVADPAAWLPMRAAGAVEAAGWLALLVYLMAGYWWRSPGLGLALPPLVVGLLLAAEATRDSAAVVRGLALSLPLRPIVAAGAAVVLALTMLATAGLLARAIEARSLGEPRLGRWVVLVVLTGAVACQSVLLALAAWSWLGRGRETPLWTLQQTWLVASWLALLLAAEASWRQRSVLPALAALGTGLLLISLVVVSGVGLRS